MATMSPNLLKEDPFPLIERFQQRGKLPTNKDVIGVMKFLTHNKTAHGLAATEVAKRVYSKWFHDSIYCHSLSTIKRRVEGIFKVVINYKKQGRETGATAEKYRELSESADKLFDIYTEDKKRQQVCEEKEFCMKMSEKEFIYLEDMRGPRRMECNNGVDPVWYTAVMRRQRRFEYEEKQRLNMEASMNFKSLDDIEDMLSEHGMIMSDHDSNSSVDSPLKTNEKRSLPSTSPKVAKRLYIEDTNQNIESDTLPVEFRNLRSSERKVKDSVYSTAATLVGMGLSVPEAIKAIVEVGNGMFGRSWKLNSDNKESFDSNTMPDDRNIRDKLRLIEAQSLSLVADELLSKEIDQTVTHSIDSTTRKSVGTFVTQGVQLGQESPYPLPLMVIHGESTADIAQQVDFGFEVLAKIKGVEAREIYKEVDVHMTDSTEHNKGVANLLQVKYIFKIFLKFLYHISGAL